MTRAHERAPAHEGCTSERAHDEPEFDLTRRALLGAAAGAAAAGLALPARARARPASSDGEFAPHVPAPPGVTYAAAAPATIPQTLSAGPGQPAIVAREAWALGQCPPRVAPEYGTVELAFVHHTENPNGYEAGVVAAMLRAIYLFHRYGRGWNDIGYNFVVDRFGRIFEARAGGFDAAVVGAHAGGYNYCSTGIAVLGEYGAVDISPAAQAALAHLLAWKLSLHGAPLLGRVTVRVNPAGAVYSRFPANARVSLPRVAGHRDADSTECPGNALYGELGAVRQGASGLAGGHAALASLLLAQGATAELHGDLTQLNGTPIAGAPIEIQARTVARRGELVQQHTLATTQTAAGGEWSLPLAPATAVGKGQWLRALCPGTPGVPAAVSDPLQLPGTLTPAPSPTAPSPSAEQPPAQ